MNSQMHRTASLAVGLLWAALSGAPAAADDSELFIGTSTAAGAQPNILLVLDNSISMQQTVFTQAEFVHDPMNLYPPGTTAQTNCRADRVYYVFGSAAQPTCDTNRWFNLAALKCKVALDNFVKNITGGWYTDNVAMYDDGSDRRWEALNTSSSFRDNAVECQDDVGSHGDGVNTSNLYPRNGGSSNGYWGTASSSNRLATNAWGKSPLDLQTVTMYSGNYMNYTYGPRTNRPKIDVAKEVARALLDSVNGVNVGLMTFNPAVGDDGSQGGYIVHEIEDIDASRTELKDGITSIAANAGTPLSESLYEAALYMSGRTWDFGNSRSVASSRLGNPNSSQYDSPIEYACQKNFVVMLTDGEPRWDSGADAKIKAMKDEEDVTFKSLVGATCDAETYPAGLSPSGGDCFDDLAEFLYKGDFSDEDGQQNITTYTVGFDIDLDALSDAAVRGGGKYYTASDTATLAASLQQIVTSILAQNTTFTAPTVAVNAFNRTQNLSDLFVSVFRPSSRLHWPGNLKRFRLDASTSEIIDKNGEPAIDPETGFFATTAQDFWSPAVDGDNVEKGGAANLLPVPTSRVVYTYQGTTTDLTHDDNRIGVSTLIDATDVGIQGSEPTLTQVINFINGVDVPDTDQDNNKTEPRNQLGDPLHSQPVSMVYGPGLREGLIFSATNDGVLHAFDLETGRERWAFIPPEFLDDQAALFDNDAASSKHYGIDGDLALQVVADSDAEIEIGDEGDEHVYLFFGMRRGGEFYYGLDVSDRSAPKLMWKIDGTTLTGVGQSWSTPVPTKIRVGGVDGEEKLVLVFGGGYEVDQDLPDSTTDTRGNSIYIVDSLTGALIWRGTKTGGNLDLAKMDYSIPSDVRVIDLDGNGLADRMYVGDMGGQVWRFDINNFDASKPLVAGGVIAQLGVATTPATTPTRANTRRFYYAPDVAIVNSRGFDYLHIGIGSGSRGNPLGTQVQDRFYALRDYAFGQMDQAGFAARSIINHSTLVSITAVNTSVPQGTKDGWYLNLGTGNGEKVLAESRTFNNEVIFTTFRPGSSGVGCIPQLGTNRVYRVSVFNASPVLNLDGSADPTALTMSDIFLQNEGSPLPAPQMIFLPPDRDFDGIPDTEDDSDEDGIPDNLDPDYDGDGTADTAKDTDADGMPDSEDDDIDNDGKPNSSDPDADGDGRDDLTYQDLNHNGIPDFLETKLSGSIVTIIGLMRFPEGYRNDPVRTYWRQGNIGQ